RLNSLRQRWQNNAGIPARIRTERPRRNRILSTRRNQPKLIRLRWLQWLQVAGCKDQRSLASNIGRLPLWNGRRRILYIQRHTQRRTIGQRIQNLPRRRGIRGQPVVPAALLPNSSQQRLALF